MSISSLVIQTLISDFFYLKSVGWGFKFQERLTKNKDKQSLNQYHYGDSVAICKKPISVYRLISYDSIYSYRASSPDLCKDAVFSISTEFNNGAFPCDCNPAGSRRFECEPIGGQCSCRANVVGRQCDGCAIGYYNFPACRRKLLNNPTIHISL